MDETYISELRELLNNLEKSMIKMKELEGKPYTPHRVKVNLCDARGLLEVSCEVLEKYTHYDSIII